jgi:hypothetical protein
MADLETMDRSLDINGNEPMDVVFFLDRINDSIKDSFDPKELVLLFKLYTERFGKLTHTDSMYYHAVMTYQQTIEATANDWAMALSRIDLTVEANMVDYNTILETLSKFSGISDTAKKLHSKFTFLRKQMADVALERDIDEPATGPVVGEPVQFRLSLPYILDARKETGRPHFLSCPLTHQPLEDPIAFLSKTSGWIVANRAAWKATSNAARGDPNFIEFHQLKDIFINYKEGMGKMLGADQTRALYLNNMVHMLSTSKGIMKNPIIGPDGYVYDREPLLVLVSSIIGNHVQLPLYKYELTTDRKYVFNRNITSRGYTPIEYNTWTRKDELIFGEWPILNDIARVLRTSPQSVSWAVSGDVYIHPVDLQELNLVMYELPAYLQPVVAAVPQDFTPSAPPMAAAPPPQKKTTQIVRPLPPLTATAPSAPSTWTGPVGSPPAAAVTEMAAPPPAAPVVEAPSPVEEPAASTPPAEEAGAAASDKSEGRKEKKKPKNKKKD